MYLVTIWLPFITAIIIGLFGSKIGALSASKIAVTSATITCILSLIVFYEVALQHAPTYIEIFNWFDSEMVSFSWGFMFDSLTATMLVVITTISMCVHWYSIEYMYTDPHKQRFMSYLSLFTFFMLILVTADNFFQLFLGWEGVGLCSYLLINFWYGRLQANKAAIKAILVNRIGDIGLALGIFLIYYLFNSLDYAVVFALAPHFKDYSIVFFNYEVNALTLICFFFFIGATGKSAQIGLHTWLPDAMEGPTPVSALIHAATMVTAGVFLAVRCSPLFEYAPAVSFIMTISGALTAFIAATIGMVQNDLKRVIAYSTCSQLGYMMIACGTSGYAIGMFHLTNHAFFKALLFLSAGSIIHALSDEQDMRRMGGLLNILPFTYNMMFIGSLSLMGFPFLTGFYSKDLILEWTYAHYSINSYFAYGLGSVSAFITAFYSMRVLSLTFLKKPLSNKIILTQAHEPNYFMTVPLIFLGICSIFVGYFLKDMMVGLGTDFWGNSIYVLPQNMLLIEAEFLEQHIKLLPVILSLLGGIVSFVSYNFAYKWLYLLKISYLGKKLYTFLNRKWFFDKVYNEIFAQNTLIFSYNNGYQNIDRGIIELFGPSGIWLVFSDISNKFNFKYTQYLDNKGHFKNFFKITFITLCFVYFLILLYHFLFNTIIFFQEEINSYNIILQKEFESFGKKISYELNIPKFFEDISIHFQKDLGLGIIQLSQLFNIIYYPTYMGKVNPYFNYALLHELSLSYNESVEDIIVNDIITKAFAAKEETEALKQIFFEAPGRLNLKCLSKEFFNFFDKLSVDEQNVVLDMLIALSSEDAFRFPDGIMPVTKGFLNPNQASELLFKALNAVREEYDAKRFNYFRDAFSVIKHMQNIFSTNPHELLNQKWHKFLDIWCPNVSSVNIILAAFVLQTAGRPLDLASINTIHDTLGINIDIILKVEEVLKISPTNPKEILDLFENFFSFLHSFSCDDQEIIMKILFYKVFIGPTDFHGLLHQFDAVSKLGVLDYRMRRMHEPMVTVFLDNKNFIQHLFKIPSNNPALFLELLKRQDPDLFKEKVMLDMLLESASSINQKDILNSQNAIIFEKFLINCLGNNLTNSLIAAHNISLIDDFLSDTVNIFKNIKKNDLLLFFLEIVIYDLKITDNIEKAFWFAEFMVNDLTFAEKMLVSAEILPQKLVLSKDVMLSEHESFLLKEALGNAFSEGAILDYISYNSKNQPWVYYNKMQKSLELSTKFFNDNYIVNETVCRDAIRFFAKDSFLHGFCFSTVLLDERFLAFMSKFTVDEQIDFLTQLQLADIIANGDKMAFINGDIFNFFLKEIYLKKLFVCYHDLIIDCLFWGQDLNKVLFKYLVLEYMRQNPCADAKEIEMYLHFGLFSDVNLFKELAMSRKEDFK